MSVFLKLREEGRKKEHNKEEKVLINKASSWLNICLPLHYFLSLGHNDVEVQKNCFKKVFTKL